MRPESASDQDDTREPDKAPSQRPSTGDSHRLRTPLRDQQAQRQSLNPLPLSRNDNPEPAPANTPLDTPADRRSYARPNAPSASPGPDGPKPPLAKPRIAGTRSGSALPSAPPSESPTGVDHGAALAATVRRAMRLVPQALAVAVAGRRRDAAASDREPERGLLVSSWTVVTLDPRPVVAFSVRVPSATYDAIRAQRWFRLYAVGDAETADGFVGPAPPEAAPRMTSLTTRTPETTALEAKRRLRTRRRLERSALWGLECRTVRDEDWGRVGDHVLVMGEVEGSWWPPWQEQQAGGRQAVLYQGGEYRAVGARLETAGAPEDGPLADPDEYADEHADEHATRTAPHGPRRRQQGTTPGDDRAAGR